MDPINRFTQMNLEFIKNLPADILSELIILEDVIPDNLSRTLDANNPIYKNERHYFLNNRDDLLQKIYYARNKRKRLSNDDNFINVRTDENIEFIKKYPQFKKLIDYIEFKDDNRNTIKCVPIDQYLAEY